MSVTDKRLRLAVEEVDKALVCTQAATARLKNWDTKLGFVRAEAVMEKLHNYLEDTRQGYRIPHRTHHLACEAHTILTSQVALCAEGSPLQRYLNRAAIHLVRMGNLMKWPEL